MALANRMNALLNEVDHVEPPLTDECCINKVPYHLRILNEESYTPKVVSIGPFHRDNQRLQTMENKKMRCLNSFLGKVVPLNLENFIGIIRPLEGRIRRCYGETSQLGSDDYVQMILLDVSFILEMFWERRKGRWSVDFTPWFYSSLMKDFILLENQIPFFIIEEIFERVVPHPPDSPSLIELTFSFFADFNVQKFVPFPNLFIKHFTDLLRIFQLPPPGPHPQSPRKELIKHLYSATQLHEAGVKFKVSSSNCLLELTFTNGVLEIPRIRLEDKTEILARNLMAFEQCHRYREAYITDYYFILDFLINTAHDVDLLRDEGILVNYLGDSSAATSIINNLNKEIVWVDMSSTYYKLYKDLNEFYENPLHSWKATLRRDYFSTPWITTSTIAAVIFLVLTIIQTVCSLIQVIPKHK